MKRVLLAVLPVVMFATVAQAELTGNPIPIGIGVAQTGNVALLGQEEVDSIVAERGDVEVGCEFCGAQYRFDAVDAAQLFVAPEFRGETDLSAH